MGGYEANPDEEFGTVSASSSRVPQSKDALKREYGTKKRKKIQKLVEAEALVKAAETGRKAEEQERKTGDVEFMAGRQADARQAAEQAMVNQLRERQNALLVTAGEPPVPFAEKALQTVGQDLLSKAPEFGAELAAGELEGAESEGMKNFGSALGNAYGTEPAALPT